MTRGEPFLAQAFAHGTPMGLLKPLVYAQAESMTQPVTLMFDPGSSAIAIKETVIAAATKNRCVLLTYFLQECCWRQKGLLAERNATPYFPGAELFRAYLETLIDRLNPLEVPVFSREAEDLSVQKGFMSKVWLITGSSRGLGRAFVEAVLEAGDRVVATARNLAQLADLEKKYGERVRAVSLDVTSEAQAKAAVDAAIESFGGLDVLVNNAGYGNVAPVEDTTLAEFRAQIETNLFGVIIMTKAVIPYFRERGAGHIIQVTSIAGRLGPVGRAPYAAAKFGVEGFSESLSREVGPLGVKVTIVEPGGFRTDFAGSSTELREGRPEYDSTVGATVRFQRNYNGKQPGDPAKAAAALLKLVSMPEPPLRLLLGSDCYGAAEKSALATMESDRKWKDLSVSTDF
jgi:NAD(P)-dependent dehydrogenase (short-subunit alcohol dehydrogenase family)